MVHLYSLFTTYIFSSICRTTNWVYPATNWVYPATNWVYPATNWVYPATNWVYPATQIKCIRLHKSSVRNWNVLSVYSLNLTLGNLDKICTLVCLGEDVNIQSGGRFKTTEEQINAYSMRIYLTIDVRLYIMSSSL